MTDEILELTKRLYNYDDIYEYANEIVNEIGYTAMALDHDVGLDRLSKEFPKVERKNLLTILLFAEEDI